MLYMKINIYVISMYLGLFLLLSCSNDDNIPTPEDDPNSYFWGYFQGKIDKEEFNLKNAKDNCSVCSMGTNVREFNDPGDSIRGMITKIKLGEKTSLNVTLFHLEKGVRYLTQSAKGDWSQNGIFIQKGDGITEGDNDKVYYLPKMEKPFKAEIINSTYKIDRWHPVIEVELDGILYCIDNSNDSIIVKGNYGARPN